MAIYDLTDAERTLGDFTLSIERCCMEKAGIYAVVGPNGCGKSTFLNLLAFISRPEEGKVVFDGREVDYGNSGELLRLRRKVGCLMQNPYLFNMSVQGNIAYGLKLRGLPRAAVQERGERIMDALGLAPLARRNAHALSGGEAQRVALARTLVLDTDVLLLDEPTANVDQRHMHAVEEWILNRNRQRHTTVVLTTHSREQAYRMSSDIISIVDGRIWDVAYENVFPGILREEADGLKMVTVGPELTLKTARGKPGPVTLAIDPRDVILSPNELTSSALNKFPGTIAKIEDINGSLRVFVDVGATICALITRRSFLDLDLNIGRRVWVTFKASAVKVI